MRRLIHSIVVIMLSACIVYAAGSWATNNWSYKPQLTTQGETDYEQFNLSQDKIDAELQLLHDFRVASASNYKTLGSPGYETLAAALTTIGSNNATLIVPEGAWVATGTVPANVALTFLKGGYLTIANGVTVTISGPVSAGPYQIFSYTGTGKLTNGCLHQGYPEWWGAVGDDSTDDTTALQSCLDASMKTVLLAKTYKITYHLVLESYHEITGCGDKSEIHQTAAGVSAAGQPYEFNGYGILVKDYCKLMDFSLQGNYDHTVMGNTSRAISWYQFTGGDWDTDHNWDDYLGMWLTAQNLHIYNWGCNAFNGCSGWNIVNNRVEHVYNEPCIVMGNYNTIANNVFSDCYSWGIDLNGGNNVVTGNRITNCGQPSLPAPFRYDGGGICLVGAFAGCPMDNIVVSNNTIDNTGECSGIYVLNYAGTSFKNLRITGNSIICGSSGTPQDGQSAININGNAEHLTQVVIADNVCKNAKYYGIYVQSMDDLVVSGNIIRDITGTVADNTRGISLADLTQFVASNNVVTNVTNTGPNAQGIVTYDILTDGYITGNVVKGCDRGFQWQTETAKRVIVRGNNFIDNTITATFGKELNYPPTYIGNKFENNDGFIAGNGIQPTLPDSDVAIQNVRGYPVMVTVIGGTVTDIQTGHASGSTISIGVTSGKFYLPTEWWVKITYSSAPTWDWAGIQ